MRRAEEKTVREGTTRVRYQGRAYRVVTVRFQISRGLPMKLELEDERFPEIRTITALARFCTLAEEIY
jgi:hypothetical protein